MISDGKKFLKVMIVWMDKLGKNIVNDLDFWVREVIVNGYEIYYFWSLNLNKFDWSVIVNRLNKFDNVE